jgi:hypothetical protein
VLHNDEHAPFASSFEGSRLWHERSEYSEAFEDTVRLYMEEADAAQGFQVFLTVGDGFTGFAKGGYAILFA